MRDGRDEIFRLDKIMKFDKILWIRGKGERKNIRPIVVGVSDNTMYWHCGHSQQPWNPRKYVVLREYSSEEMEKAFHDLDLKYAPVPQAPCARLGWISPDGDFYPCGYCCHNELESLLGKKLYDTNYPQLRQRGWIEIKSSAIISFERGRTISPEAKNTIRKIVEAFEHEEFVDSNIDWNKQLRHNPEGYDSQPGWSEPTDGYHSHNTYAQEMRHIYELLFGEGDLDLTNVVNVTPDDVGDKILSKRLCSHPGD